MELSVREVDLVRVEEEAAAAVTEALLPALVRQRFLLHGGAAQKRVDIASWHRLD